MRWILFGLFLLTSPANANGPVAEAGPDQAVNEGSPVTFDGTGSTGTIVSYEWEPGDGSPRLLGVSPSYAYADNGVYTVALKVTDDNGATDFDTVVIDVHNVAPVADAGGPYAGTIGNPIAFSGSFADPGPVDTHTFRWDFGDGSPPASGQAVSHTYAAAGVYTVTFRVTDDDGAYDTDTATATVVATAGITAPDPIVQECDGGHHDATVNFLLEVTGAPPSGALLTVRDVTGNRTLLSEPAASGVFGVGPHPFPLGTSTVEAEITENGERLAFASFTVQIQDTVAPALSGCVSLTIECRGPLTAIDPELLGISAVDDCDPEPTIVLAPAAVGLGTTAVAATARDATGNAAECTFDVTVVDTTAPVFEVRPEDITRLCDGHQTTIAFDILATDLCGNVDLSCVDQDGRAVDPSGTGFGIGAHTVTCTAADPSGNTAVYEFSITILDQLAPVIVCPQDITVGNAPGECFAVVHFEVEATDLCDPTVAILCRDGAGNAVRSGDIFIVGTTTVTCTATDTSGNSASSSFSITVQDREAPTLTYPAEARLVTDCAGATLTPKAADLGVDATDNCDLAPTVVVSPAALGPGTHVVTVTATDDDGNESSCVVSVTVLKGPFDCQFLRPLDGNVDNRVHAGRGVPVKLKVTCDNVFVDDAIAAVDEVVRIDGDGTPIGNEVVEDSGAANDNDGTFRLADDHYRYNLSTMPWDGATGARHALVVRIRRSGHVDTLCTVYFVNK